ncbi:MAG: choice-of-anchor Q domain-containing protein [Chloroflexota bacterium]
MTPKAKHPEKKYIKKSDDPVVSFWHAQLQTAARNPWLASLLLQRAKRLGQRLTYFYQRLASQPRRWRRRLKRTIATGIVGCALLLAWSPNVSLHAANISVTPGATGINGSDGCSLVEAIINANNDAATHPECASGSGADTITLAGNSYTYATPFGTNSALPDITSQITLSGANATIARSAVGGTPDFRLVRVSASGDLTLNDVTLSNGQLTSIFDTGAGIFSEGSLTINNSTLQNNQATADGGGLFVSAGMADISNSTISGNSASRGGGVYNRGNLTLNSSTLSGNSTTSNGAGIYNGGSATLNNSTLSNNTSPNYGGGFMNYDGAATFNNSTVTGNSASLRGGGIFHYSFQPADMLTLNRTLISGNTSPTANELYRQAGTINVNNYNLIGHSGESNYQAYYGLTLGLSDIVATSDGGTPTPLASILNSSLANNGGPTLTHNLVFGSPALNAAPAGIATDQRGVARPFGSSYDIGSVEFNQLPEVMINGSQCLLVDAIIAANTDTTTNGCAAGSAGADTITLLQDVQLTQVNNDNNGPNGLPLIISPITIEGGNFTIMREGSVAYLRILHVAGSGSLTLNQTTIKDGHLRDSGEDGAGILNEGSLTVNNSTLSGNQARGSNTNGGGIRTFNSHGLNINNSVLTQNYAQDGGGAVSGGGTITDSIITANSTRRRGGGVYINGGNLTIRGSTISGNRARGGGGIAATSGTVLIENSTISQSYVGYSEYGGGGINNSGATITINNSTITHNEAYGGSTTGAGIANRGGTINLNQTVISGNFNNNDGSSAPPAGDEVVVTGGTVNADNFNLFGHGGQADTQAFVGFAPGTNDLNATSDGSNTPLASILNTTLANNGGPATPGGIVQTHALVSGSPAIDAAPAGLSTDQRGVARPQDGDGNGTAVFDIGAVEFPIAVQSVVINSNGSADISFTPGLALWSSSQPYGNFSQVDGTSGSYNHPNATAAPSYWEVRADTTVLDSFGIFPFTLVPGS